MVAVVNVWVGCRKQCVRWSGSSIPLTPSPSPFRLKRKKTRCMALESPYNFYNSFFLQPLSAFSTVARVCKVLHIHTHVVSI
jgi:hypothetical protein